MFPAARRLSFRVAHVARSPLALSARKPGQMRRLMSTMPAEGEAAAAAAEAPKHWARYDNPPMVWLAGILGTVYILAIRWALKDRALAKKIDAMEAEKAAAVAATGPAEAASGTSAATSAPATTASVPAKASPVAAVAVNSADPSTWKVADTCAWLETVELGDHAEAFKTHAVDGKLLLSLTEQEMYSTLNIVSPLRRKKLTMAIAELRSAYMNP